MKIKNHSHSVMCDKCSGRTAEGSCPVLWDNLDGGGDWTQPNSDSNRGEDKVLIHKLIIEYVNKD